uniref:Uncharacterized protein n=1 Tax=Trypanosoma congolense (strain IL3000) TaxID=1068625 RepID=G0URU3_TRYCI|nr:conserved hypothetical protein [Trypanosoma congolense IL3000]
MSDKECGALRKSSALFLNDTDQFVFDFGGPPVARETSPASSASHRSGSPVASDHGHSRAEGKAGSVDSSDKAGSVASKTGKISQVVPLDANAVRRCFDRALEASHRILIDKVPLDDAIEQFQFGLRRYVEVAHSRSDKRQRSELPGSRGERHDKRRRSGFSRAT